MSIRSKFCIVGIPDHQGVINVGGRIGAARGPEAFRKIFKRFRGRITFDDAIQSLGDVSGLTVDVATNHRLAIEAIRNGHQATGCSVVIGGGHDHGYSQLAGVLTALRDAQPRVKLGCINIDAHLDIRKPDPLITSGSPFFLAVESGILHPKNLIEFGIQDHCNSPPLWKYASEKGIEIIPFSELRRNQAVNAFNKSLQKLSKRCDAIVISLDLDAVASSFSPGVSAPQSEGFSASEIIEMMEIAGQTRKVVSLGVFELNPEHDEGERSARLAATAVYHFLENKY